MKTVSDVHFQTLYRDFPDRYVWAPTSKFIWVLLWACFIFGGLRVVIQMGLVF